MPLEDTGFAPQPEIVVPSEVKFTVPPALKATVPVGVPEFPVTRTVKVTDWPDAIVYADESIPRLGAEEPGPVVGGGGVGLVGGGVGLVGGGVGLVGGGVGLLVPPE